MNWRNQRPLCEKKNIFEVECLTKSIRLYREKTQISGFVRMPQLYISLYFRLIPIAVINIAVINDSLILLVILKTFVAPSHCLGKRIHCYQGCAIDGFGEVEIGEHLSYGGLTT